MRPASFTSHYSLHIHPQHTDLNSGATASANSTSFHIPIPLPQLSFPELRLRQTLLQPHSTTSLLPPAWPLLRRLHSHWHSTQRTQPPSQAQATPEQYPNFGRTLLMLLAFPQQHPPLHHHSAHIPRHLRSGLDPRTPSHCQLDAYTQLALHLTPPQSLKPKVGNSPNIERTFTPDWPLTNVSFDDYDNANRPSENHTFTLPPNTTLSHFSATSPNTQQPPLKQQNNCAAAAIQT